MAFTWDEVRQIIRDTNDDNLDAKSERLERRVANNFLRWFSAKHKWHHYKSQLFLQAVTGFNSGTVTVTSGTALVAIAGASFPTASGEFDNAGIDGRRIQIAGSDFWFEIASGSSGGSSVTMENPWLFPTASGQTFQVIRDKYWLPADFRAGGDIHTEDLELWATSLDNYQRRLRLFMDGVGQPFAAVWSKDGRRDRHVLFVSDPPSELQAWGGWYWRTPAEITAATTSGTTVDFPEEYSFMLEEGVRWELAKAQRRDSQEFEALLMKSLRDSQASDNLYRGSQPDNLTNQRPVVTFVRGADA